MKKLVPFVNGLKPCSGCHKMLPREEFHKSPTAISGAQSRCKKCRNEKCKEWCMKHRERRKQQYTSWVRNNPEKRRNSILSYIYGITLEQYNSLLESQDGKCKICLKQKQLVVDHDHDLNEVRGLLCHKCNQALGFFKDDEENILRAAFYLRESKKCPTP